MADRIQGQAIRRCGELLREIESQSLANLRKGETPGGIGADTSGGAENAADAQVVPPMTRIQAARDAGFSKRQAVTAVRVSRVPEEQFEKQIGSENPPTVTQLAEQGKRPAPKPIVDLEGIDPGLSKPGSSNDVGICPGRSRRESRV